MCKCKQKVWLMALSCWATVALAGPQEDYDAGVKAQSDRDMVGAMQMFRRAADAGHAMAQAQLANILDKSEFNLEAVSYYRKSADQGNADGQLGLGTMYAVGEGVKQDLAEARKWVTLAAEQGHKKAINMLAGNYLSGGLGLADAARQGPEALRWITRAAENDNLRAIDALAVAYRTGQYGLAVDPKQADMWAAKANKIRGWEDGKSTRSKMKK